MRHPRLPAAAAHVFVDNLAAPALADADAHHLARVLRLRAGEVVTASDGRGSWRTCRYVEGAQLEPDGLVEASAGDAAEKIATDAVTVAFALAKGDKPEIAVQKLTEVGVDRIVPFAAARSVVVWDDAKAARNVERLRAVARAAAMQSRRVWLPVVDSVTTFGALASVAPGIALAHGGGRALSADDRALAVGPEGGWDPSELAAHADQVDMGTTTLRAETAALAAGVLLTACRDRRIRPV